MITKVELKCLACNKNHITYPVRPNTIKSAYFDMTEWLDIGVIRPKLSEKGWPRGNHVPTIGEKRTIKVRHPFKFNIHDEFCTFFMPALSSLNGWDSYPEEIDNSAIVCCKLVSIYELSEYEAWVEVEIMNSYKISVIAEKEIKFSYDNFFLEDYSVFESIFVLEYENYIYVSASIEGDIGAWSLIYKENEKYKLLLHSEWNVYQDIVYYTNMEIPIVIIKKLINDTRIVRF